MFQTRWQLTLALVAGIGCAGGPAGQASPEAGPNAASTASRNSNVLTREDLSDPALVGIDLLQAIRRLRPQYLTTRGTVSRTNAMAGAVQVSLDGGTLQSVNTLNTVRTDEVQEVRYYDVSEAAQKFGTTAMSGPVLAVKRR